MTTPLIISPTDPIISHPDTVILDASWLYEPDPPTRDAYKEFLHGPRFPGARFWSLDDVSEPHPDGYALMLPSPERFARFAGEHGINQNSHVVVYDSEGIFSAPRTVWTFKKVTLIDGGLPRAKAEGVKLETGAPQEYKCLPLQHELLLIASRTAPLENGTVLIDARPAASYESGHIPTSLLFDFPEALLKDPAGYTYLREPEKLKKYFVERIGVEAANKVFSGESTVVNIKITGPNPL
ncbi:hypothetical protein V866_004703 [Kwoniella sp. B9012]|uniref:Rhodanese domain-containing protein n=1 Tax=Kwoniella europaea PYCC6329 TaxID=1423913 RepID=A0AAX4KLG6_9TREE